MSVVLEQLVTPGFRAGVYLGNALWHSSALLHFGFRPEFMLKKLSARQKDAIADSAGDAYVYDVMRYLGGINAGYALLSLLRFIPLYGVILSKGPNAVATSSASREVQAHLDILALTALGLANASQAYCNFFVAKPSNRWIVGTWRGSKTDRITILDAFFTVLDFSIVGARLAGF